MQFKEFKKKETMEKKISIKDIVKNDGSVKLDPMNNPRVPMGGSQKISMNGSTDKIVRKDCRLTKENNEDYTDLIKDIAENGYDDQKERVVIMDLVDYLYGLDNRSTIVDVYKDDVHFVRECNSIIKILEDTSLEGLEGSYYLAGHRQRYYIVVGGNTRIAILKELYEKDPKAFKGHMATKIPCNLINYRYHGVLDRDYEIHQGDNGTAKDMYDTARMYQIAYVLTAYAQHAKDTMKNTPSEMINLSRAYIADVLVRYCDLHGQDRDDLAYNKIASFEKAYQDKGFGLKANILAEGLIYKQVADYVARTGRETSDKVVNAFVKVLAPTICMKKTAETCELVGFDPKTYKITKNDRFEAFLDLFEDLYEAEGKCQIVAKNAFKSFVKKEVIIDGKTIDDGMVNDCLEYVKKDVIEAKRADDKTAAKVLAKLVADGVISQTEVDALRAEVAQ